MKTAYIKTGICLFLLIAVFFTYWQIRYHDPINADDFYVTGNRHLDNAYSYQGLVDGMTTPMAGVWMPLTYLSIGALMELFGTDFGAYRIYSMLLHAGNAIIVFLLLTLMTGAIWRSALVAALFAVHPLNVESVAWLVCIRVVQCGFFSLLSVYLYALYVHHRSSIYYTLSLFFYAAGLFSVPMFVPLPLLLLLLDFWPLGRLGNRPDDTSRQNISLSKIGRAVWEKFPFFSIMAVIIAVLLFSHDISSSPGIDRYPFHERLFNALISYVLFIQQTLLPTGLAVFYPFPEAFPLWKITGAVMVLAAITILSVLFIRRAPFLIIGWLWFAGMLFPLSGIAQIGTQARADHYAYIPIIGLFIMLCWGGALLIKKLRIPPWLIFPAAIMVIALSIFLARQQAGHWQNSITIMSHAIRAVDNNYEGHNYLAQAAASQGDLETAGSHFYKAISIKPDHLKSHVNLANTYLSAGETEKAIIFFNRALAIDPGDERLHNNLGALYEKTGHTDQALFHYRRAVTIHPGYATAYDNLAVLEAETGDISSAITNFKQALRLNPQAAETHFRLAWTLNQAGRTAAAVDHIRQALDLEPGNRRFQQFLTFLLREKFPAEDAQHQTEP